jgi:hypothetical protein
MKILLGDFNAKVCREDIKLTLMNKSPQKINNDNGVRVVNSTKSKNLVVKSTMSLIATFISTPGPLLREKRTIKLMMI